MTWLAIVLGFVVLQRLAELWLAGRNTRRLKARGAVEIGASHYPLFVILHTGWLVAIAALTPWTTTPNAGMLLIYLALQVARVWVIATLSPFWTTRIISLAGEPLVRKGPYRFIRHPNYWVASLEIAVLPLAFGQIGIAVVFSLLNLLLVAYRVRIENGALAGRR